MKIASRISGLGEGLAGLPPALSSWLHQHCIRQGPEISEYLRRFRRVHHSLGQQDSDHSFRWIRVSRSSKSSGPTESARGGRSSPDFESLAVLIYSVSVHKAASCLARNLPADIL